MAQSKALGNVFKLDAIINVKDPKYGAKGDGTTDDSAAFAAALTAAAGAALYVPTGTYKITTTLTPSSGTLIYGDGIGSVLANAQTSSNFLTATSVNDITLRSLKFISSDSTHTPVTTFALCNQILIEDCVWSCALGANIGTTALRLQGSTFVVVRNCQFYNANSSIYIDKSGTTYSDYVLVDGCHFEYTAAYTTATPTGVYHFNCNHGTVVNSFFKNIYDNSAATIGYSVYDGDGTTLSIEVSHCVSIVTAALPHIMVQSSTALHCNVSKNRFYGTALGAGASVVSQLANVRSSLSYVLIEGNYAQQGGILVAGGATVALAVRVCEVLNNQIAKIEQNTAGIRIGVSTSNFVDYASVRGNTVANTYASSINISEAAYFTVEDNKCLNWNTVNKQPASTYAYTAAIYVQTTTPAGKIRNNTIENNSAASMVTGFPQYGIVADAQGSIILMDNNIIGAMTVANVLNLQQGGVLNSGKAVYPLTTAAETLVDNKVMTINLTDDTHLKFSVRGSDGTTRTNTLTLA